MAKPVDRPKPVWKDCTGEAHSNPFIDHCMVCMPYWGRYPTCPKCGRKLKPSNGSKTYRFKCPECKEKFD